jgi:DNA-binding beta-propeller fold protein YncE
MTSQTLRRGFLRDCATLAGVGCLATVGCVPTGQGPLPDLVWGRRGFSPGRFQRPRAVTIDELDQLYIVDITGRIQVFDADGNLIRWWSTPQTKNGRPTGLAIASAPRDTRNPNVQNNGPAKGSGLNSKTPAKPADQKRLLVADTHYYRMLAYTLEGELCDDEQIGGVAGHSPGEFAFVTDAVCDDQGCYYIGEYNASDRIQKFAPDGSFVTQFGGNGQQPGQLFRPQSLVIRDDVLWVADACNHRIQRFDIREETPRLIDVWGSAGTGNGQFYFPYDLTIASDGTVVVVEYKNNRIQRFDPAGKWIATWGGPGFDPGRLNQPWGVVVDSKDRIHVLDSYNHRVQRLHLPG